MGATPPDSTAGPAGGRLGADLAAHVEAIVHAAEREARAAERAIAEHRRSAEQEVARYLAAARLHVDAEAAARAARIETLGAAARRLSDELADAVAALNRELRADERDAATPVPRPPWPSAPSQPEPTWSRTAEPQPSADDADRAGGAEAGPITDGETTVPSAARLVAIEMAVGGSSRAEVEQHLRDRLGVAEPEPLLDDVFGAASHAGSRLAWGEA